MANNTYLSIRGPRTAGPRRAMHGAMADMRRASPLSSPTDSICSGRNGKMHPMPVEQIDIYAMVTQLL